MLIVLGASMLVFRPNWQARIEAGPRSALVCIAAILLLIGFIGFAGFSYH